MEKNTLSLPVGTNLQIQATVPDNSPRFMVKVVGYVPGLSLIVNTPAVNGNIQLVRPGQRFTVRLLRGSSIVAFVAEVLDAPVKPFPHLHLKFPKDFEQVNVRTSARVNANIASKVRNTANPDSIEHYRDATIVDLSESGLRLAAMDEIAETGSVLQVNFRLDVLNQLEEFSLIGDVMNVSDRMVGKGDDAKKLYSLGVKFKSVNRYQQVLIYAWVMKNIAENKTTPG